VLAVAAVLGLSSPAPASAFEDGPVVGVSASVVEPGQEVLITSRGWTPGALVNLEVCGQSGTGGSTTCAVATSTASTADAAGTVVELVEVSVPPVPCPCVVRATAGDDSATVPITIPGAPMGTLTIAGAPRPADVDVDATVEGSGPWTSWLGASPVRTLVVRLHNPGDAPIDDVELYVTVGKGDDPARIVPAPVVAAIPPGETATYRIPVSLGGLAFGGYAIALEVVGGAEPLVVERQTTAYPWGLGVVLVIVVQAGLLGLRNRLRRRVVGADRTAGGDSEVVEIPLPDVIDLTDRQPATKPVAVPSPPRPVAVPSPPRPLPGQIEALVRVRTAARAVADTAASVVTRPTAARLDALDLLAGFEARAEELLERFRGRIDELQAELAGACADIREEAAALAAVERAAVEASAAGLDAALSTFERRAELARLVDDADDGDVIDITGTDTTSQDAVDEGISRGILRALRG
jgi:hypothetical protein